MGQADPPPQGSPPGPPEIPGQKGERLLLVITSSRHEPQHNKGRGHLIVRHSTRSPQAGFQPSANSRPQAKHLHPRDLQRHLQPVGDVPAIPTGLTG